MYLPKTSVKAERKKAPATQMNATIISAGNSLSSHIHQVDEPQKKRHETLNEKRENYFQGHRPDMKKINQ
jgi:hypothetical protein